MSKLARRDFLRQTAAVTVTLVLGGCGSSAFEQVRSTLATALADLADEAFADLAATADLNALYTRLAERDVLSAEGDYRAEAVVAQAATDTIVAHGGRYYTETERDLYTFAYALNR